MVNGGPRWARLVLGTGLVSVMLFPASSAGAQAASPDAHYCLLDGSRPPRDYFGDSTVVYDASVDCYTDSTRTTRGDVAAIDLTVEILTYDVGGSPLTLTGDTWLTGVANHSTVGVRYPDPLNPGYCQDGQFWGRATSTVRYRSGSPEYITVSDVSRPVFLHCQSSGLPGPTPPDIPIPPPTTSPPSPTTSRPIVPLPGEPCRPPKQPC